MNRGNFFLEPKRQIDPVGNPNTTGPKLLAIAD